MRKLHNDENGLAVVEATILLPFCMIMVIAIFYAAIFMCQKANLQANLENTLLYYKNTYSDTYVAAKGQMAYQKSGEVQAANGSSFEEPVEKFPYRFFGMKFNSAAFESFFRSMCGNMFFDTGSNVKVHSDKHNYIIYKTLTAKVSQQVKPAVSLAMVGGPRTMEIEATGTVVINDGDDFIRNVDFIIDVTSKTAFGQKVSEMVGKVTDLYGKFKEKFNITSTQ